MENSEEDNREILRVNLGQMHQPMRAEFSSCSVSVKIMSLLPCLTWIYSKSMNFIHLCLSVIKNSPKHIRKVKMLVALSCPTLCEPVIIYSPPSSSVHGILQARIIEWVAILFLGYLPNQWNELGSPALQADSSASELSHLKEYMTRSMIAAGKFQGQDLEPRTTLPPC